ncbi:MAG: FAD-dependent oxidoreductase [Balneolaceae bacterium]
MFNKSLWNTFADTTDFPALKKDISVDVAVIGGGITGLTIAHHLSEKGLTVAVLEAAKVGAGTTSHSTGNLYNTIDKNLGMLRAKYDANTLADVVKARNSAVDAIEQIIYQFEIECDFKRQPWYMYSAAEENNDRLERELETGKEIGLLMSKARDSEIPFATKRAIKIDGQAQLNPMLYVQGFAKNIDSKKCRIYENTKVTDVEEHGGYLLVHTDNFKIKAEHVVHATHTPKGIKFVQTLLGPYREYGIACTLEENNHPEGIFWGYFEGKEKISTRTYHKNGEVYLVVVGKPHKTGQTDNNIRHIKELEEFARHHFSVKEITNRWGGQHYVPADSLPYIGREQKDSNVYLATGFSTDGLIYGTLAGIIISDLITGTRNTFAELFDSTRNQPLKAAKEFVKENLNVAKQYLRNIPGTLSDEDLAGIAPGEGKVLEKGDNKLAIYKDEDGKMDACSAVCTHMACIVNWNNAEKTWDCPCHASRFATDGTVLEGPAYTPLQKVNLQDAEE